MITEDTVNNFYPFCLKIEIFFTLIIIKGSYILYKPQITFFLKIDLDLIDGNYYFDHIL